MIKVARSETVGILNDMIKEKKKPVLPLKNLNKKRNGSRRLNGMLSNFGERAIYL